MADTTPDRAENVPRSESGPQEPVIDWIKAERSPEFRELLAKRRRFVYPATAFFLVWYLGFVALAGYAPDFMTESLYEGFTVGYGLAMTQFVMVAVLGWLYVRKSDREFDGLSERAAQRAVDVGAGDPPEDGAGPEAGGVRHVNSEVDQTGDREEVQR